ncbi:MAG: hypothetical protein IH991_23005 [Planctomycetes bacterium]|nr:hypothetical protein [Planctomycetota bacterium]
MQQASDAAFFDMVHVLVSDSEDDPKQRESKRHVYECIQLLAPYDGSTLPTQGDFCKVLCQDLSANGFGFYTEQSPKTKYVIIALGTVPFIFYVAEVMNSRPVERDGQSGYLVGCHLMERLAR